MVMYMAINGVELPVYPSTFEVSVMDLDDAESTTRTADGTLSRDRIATKRQIELSWPAITWDKLSVLLRSIQNPFFDFTYPDPETGQMETKTFYVGNRKSPLAFERNGVYWWSGLQMTFTEQ